ncbi:hypothetical protein tb265_14550 [Gemmatimonadetes bacterium T265]|nr:hypothetical protein tb265_14550 [Gemmatimonadetes bacterium T265]
MSADVHAAALDGDVRITRRGFRERGAGPLTRGTPARAALDALGAALVLGVAGDLLLRAGAPALNVLLCTALGLALLAWLARERGRPVTVGAAGVGALALAFAAAVAWRDSPTLLVLNVAALATTACALAAMVRHGAALPLESFGPRAYVGGAASTAGAVAGGARALARLALDAASGRGRQVGAALGIGARGAALAFPALVVFGTLLAAADGAFARLAHVLVDWDAGVAVAHVLWTAAGAWAAAGYLYAALRSPPEPGTAGVGRATPLGARRDGPAEWCVALALVDVLFVVFGVVQVGWLFGGRALVASTSVTYAEYARRGFFELVAVAALALPVALGAYGAGVRRLAAADPRARRRLHRALRVAAGTLLGCVGVVLVSAADRMRLYEGAYGLTELRFYATAFMAWLAVVGACAAATILRDRPAPFALGTLVSAWGWVLVLDAANPDARIVGVNAARATRGRPFDAAYAAWLSADAVPGLLAYLSTTPAAAPADEACTVVSQLDAARRAADGADWRTRHLARWRAGRLVARAERDGRLAPWRAACAAGRSG